VLCSVDLTYLKYMDSGRAQVLAVMTKKVVNLFWKKSAPSQLLWHPNVKCLVNLVASYAQILQWHHLPITFYGHVVDAILQGSWIIHPLNSWNLVRTLSDAQQVRFVNVAVDQCPTNGKRLSSNYSCPTAWLPLTELNLWRHCTTCMTGKSF